MEYNNDTLSLCEHLAKNGFDATKFNIPLEFWLKLNLMTDEEWILLTDELFELIGFKSCESNPSVGRSNLLKFIRKMFVQGVDFMEHSVELAKTGRGGAHHKIEIHMKKRPFKRMLVKVGTSTSDLIHEYLLDIEEGCTKYALYQEQCKHNKIIEENNVLKKMRIEAPPEIEIDLSPFPEISIQTYANLPVLYLIYCKQHNALKFGITDDIIVRYQKHCRTLGTKQGDVKLVYILNTEFASVVESSLKQCVFMNGWKKENLVINNSLQSELVDLTKTTIQNVINLIELFVTEHTNVTKMREDAIINKSNEMEKFRIQSELESKKLQLHFELESKKLDLRIKKVELQCKKIDAQKHN